MKLNKKNLILAGCAVLILALVLTVAVKAATGGLLTPPSSAFSNSAPTATMNSVSDTYNKLNPAWQPDDGYCSTTVTTLCNTHNGNADCPNGETCIATALCWTNGEADGDAGGEAESCASGDPVNNTLLDPTGTGSPLLGAVEFCAYLNAAGTGLNCSNGTCTKLNAWRLPTLIELTREIANEYLPGGNGGTTSNLFQPTPFGAQTEYWSSVSDGAGDISGARFYFASGIYEIQDNASTYATVDGNVRCISNDTF